MAKEQNPSGDPLKSEILSSIRDEAEQQGPGSSDSAMYYKGTFNKHDFKKKADKYTKDGYVKDNSYNKRN